MALLFNKENQELIVTCDCGCEESLHMKVDTDDSDVNFYAFISYMNGKFYNHNSIWSIFKDKCRKIWSIIRNKDYYYSDIILTKEDFETLKTYINSIK